MQTIPDQPTIAYLSKRAVCKGVYSVTESFFNIYFSGIFKKSLLNHYDKGGLAIKLANKLHEE